MKKFTLLELAIVLGILAAIASVLLDNFATVKLQEYHKQTLERGELVQNAMLGRNTQTGFSEFLSDMGRWPKIYNADDDNFKRNLAELYDSSVWDHSSSGSMFNHRESVEIDYQILDLDADPPFSNYSFPTVSMQVGWGGGYLGLNLSENEDFTDAWGNPWKIMTNCYLKEDSDNKLTPDYTPITEDSSTTTAEIDGIISYGGNNVEDDSEDEDVNIVDADSEFEFSFNRNYASLNITLKVRDDFDPKTWNDLIIPEAPSEYNSLLSYSKGSVVYVDESSDVRHYYTASIDVSAGELPYSTSYTVVNSGWKYGALSNYISKDQLKLLLFSPAKSDDGMTAGLFRCAPYDIDESSVDKLFPALYSIDGSTLTMDIDATTDSDVDQEVETGEYNSNRLRTNLSWEYDEDSLPANLSSLRLSWLVPGRRQIYVFGSYENNTYIASAVENIELKSGENYITIYLEQKR